MMTREELEMCRAVNFCTQNRETMVAEAIKRGFTVGELYVQLKREGSLNEFLESTRTRKELPGSTNFQTS